MDLFSRNLINNYTSNIISKKDLEDFLNDIKNHILILEENDKNMKSIIQKNSNLIFITNSFLLLILIFFLFFVKDLI
jgi:hypothetical protein